MKVFISWSGRGSKHAAQALHQWIGMVLQEVEPFMSSEDIEHGSIWFTEIIQQLQDTDYGIVCITPDNVRAPWILFEAGALIKQTSDKARVVPLIFGMDPADVTPPLSELHRALPTK